VIGVACGLKAQMDNSKTIEGIQSPTQFLYKLQDYAKQLLPQKHRVHVCQNVPDYYSQLNGTHGGVSRKPEGHHVLHGFGSCGDVRACHVCGNKVGLQRAEEVKAVLRWHRKENAGIAVLLTYTCRHTSSTDLKFIAKALADSKRCFSSYTAVKNIKMMLGYTNLISARDMTHSFVNGHHPHYHDIWLCNGEFFKAGYDLSLPLKFRKFGVKHGLFDADGSLSIDSVKKFLAEQWIIACVKNGLSAPTVQRGFDIKYRENDGSDSVGSYLIKWAYELTTPHKKKGRRESKTPTQLLSSIYNEKGEFQYKYAKAWIEYIEAFTGTASIYFGKGLKAAAGIDDLTDEELAEKPLPVQVRAFEYTERLAVTYFRSQRKVLHYFDNYSIEVCEAFINELQRSYIEQRDSEIKMRWHLRKRIAESTADIIANLFIQQLDQDAA